MRVLSIFGEFLMSYKGYWVCSNEQFRRVVEKIYYQKSEVKNALHKRIANSLEKSPNCIRKLEEQTYHYYCCRDDFMLKQIIATIENFLILFNPNTKFDLFRYWQILEQFGYDPVTEYNKGVELFDSHYNPEPDKLFVIILQVCRFLKEFSDFETGITPSFRHPMIRGKVGVIRNSRPTEEEAGGSQNNTQPQKTTQTAGKSQRVKLKSLSQKDKGRQQTVQSKRIKNKEDPLGLADPFYNEDNELSDIEEKREYQAASKNFETHNFLDVIGLLRELKNFKLTTDAAANGGSQPNYSNSQTSTELRYEEKIIIKSQFDEVLAHWEEVNVDVPEGRQRFRNHFIELLQQKYSHKNKLKQQEEEEKLATVQQETLPSHRTETPEDAFQKEEVFHKHEYQSRMDEIDLEIKPEQEPCFYYYKRWIWIIFPWACLSIRPDLNFSDMIARCYSSATKYMRIEEEKQFYRDALQIAIEYKMKKKAIYSKKHDEESDISTQQQTVDDEEAARQERIRKLKEAQEKQPKPDEIKTFSNLIVKKKEYEKELNRLRPINHNTSAASGLPQMSRLALTRSQATIKPNLKGINPRDKLFITNNDGSMISVENLSM